MTWSDKIEVTAPQGQSPDCSTHDQRAGVRHFDEFPWLSSEVDTLRRHYLECAHRPDRLKGLFPKRPVWQIDLKAKQLGIIRELPDRQAERKSKIYVGSRSANLEGDQPRPGYLVTCLQIPKGQKRKRFRERAWTEDENAVIRRNYPIHGADQAEWDTRLFGRRKGAIEAQAAALGLTQEQQS